MAVVQVRRQVVDFPKLTFQRFICVLTHGEKLLCVFCTPNWTFQKFECAPVHGEKLLCVCVLHGPTARRVSHSHWFVCTEFVGPILDSLFTKNCHSGHEIGKVVSDDKS